MNKIAFIEGYMEKTSRSTLEALQELMRLTSLGRTTEEAAKIMKLDDIGKPVAKLQPDMFAEAAEKARLAKKFKPSGQGRYKGEFKDGYARNARWG